MDGVQDIDVPRTHPRRRAQRGASPTAAEPVAQTRLLRLHGRRRTAAPVLVAAAGGNGGGRGTVH